MTKHNTPLAYFVGIGGIGISALARWFLAKNWSVFGSDIAEGKTIEELRKEGVKVKIGHKKSNLLLALRGKKLTSPPVVIYNPAIPRNNPELREAIRLGIRPMSHVEVLGCFTKIYDAVCVAGSHGKSTTTAILGLVLKEAGLDPLIVVGTKLPYLRGRNFRYGRNKLLVLEADEWNRSFLNYKPAVAVVTNIDKEHLDTYKNLADVKKTFLHFLSHTKEGGTLVLNRDDRNLYSLRLRIVRIAKRKLLKVLWYSSDSRRTLRLLRSALEIPGEHNISNALAAYKVATEVFGVKPSLAIRAIGKYRGAWRRMEFRGYCKLSSLNCKLPVYDDYAHHPAEIRATLRAFHEKYSNSPLICVYQPHQAKRLQVLFQDFVDAFKDVDILILLPVYEVPGRDIYNSRYTSQKLAFAIKKKYPRKTVFYLKNPKQIRRLIQNALHPSLRPPRSLIQSIIIMMGAGDIVNYTPLLLRN